MCTLLILSFIALFLIVSMIFYYNSKEGYADQVAHGETSTLTHVGPMDAELAYYLSPEFINWKQDHLKQHEEHVREMDQKYGIENFTMSEEGLTGEIFTGNKLQYFPWEDTTNKRYDNQPNKKSPYGCSKHGAAECECGFGCQSVDTNQSYQKGCPFGCPKECPFGCGKGDCPYKCAAQDYFLCAGGREGR